MTCDAFAQFSVTSPTGDVHGRGHSGPAGGADRWDVALRPIGDSVDGRALAGPDGLLYEIKSDGLIQMYRRGDSGWEQWEDGAYTRDFHTTLGGYTSPARRNRITVDPGGDFYHIRGNGQLHRAILDIETLEPRPEPIDGDWSRFDLISAAGPGVLYARDSDGTPHRHHYDASTGGWTDRGTPVVDGRQRFTQAGSPEVRSSTPSTRRPGSCTGSVSSHTRRTDDRPSRRLAAGPLRDHQ